MDISIIIPVYNAETFLNHCLDSVLRDPGRDFELILVDDGSNDGSLALCRDAAARDDRVRVHHQENRGPGGACFVWTAMTAWRRTHWRSCAVPSGSTGRTSFPLTIFPTMAAES